MSDSVGLSTTALSDAERVDLRRFMGYPAYGVGPSGSFENWRFFQVYGLMEYRLTNVDPAELQVLRLYLSNLYILEANIPAIANLNVAVAGPLQRNMSEITDRRTLFNGYRRELCAFLGLPPGPGLQGGGGMRRVI